MPFALALLLAQKRQEDGAVLLLSFAAVNPNPEPRIVADSRESRSGVPARLESLGAALSLERLEIGDYDLGGGCVVERKTVRDLHLTLINGRFWQQIGRLRRGSGLPVFVLEGIRLDALMSNDVTRGVCISVLEQGIVFLRTADTAETSEWLVHLARRIQFKRRHIDRPPHAKIPKVGSEEAGEAMLCAVPGISVDTARRILRRFGSVAAVAAADPGDWREVDGVGPKRAHALAVALYGATLSRSRSERAADPST